MPRKFLTIMRDERALAMVEYALLAAFIALIAIAALTTIGTHLSTNFSTLAEQMAS